MKRILVKALVLVSHRLLPPVVCGLFLLLYIGTAFFTDDALVTLVQLTGYAPPALGLLVLVAVNALLRIGADKYGQASALAVAGKLDTVETARILGAEGYRVTVREGFVDARRGVSLFIPRLLWRLTVFLLFVGVALSLSSRRSLRLPVIEGEQLQIPDAAPRSVERITLETVPGHPFLQRRLTISLLTPDGGRDVYGIYPPRLLGSAYLYPRYLALAPLLQISLPDSVTSSADYRMIKIYPPGREDEVVVSDEYRLKLVIPQRGDSADPFQTARFNLHVRLLKGDQLFAEGDLPFGGSFEANGFSVALLDARRYVVTDFVRDYGVPCIWSAFVLLLAAVTLYLPLRYIWPRREMLFSADGEGGVSATCYSEGRNRGHDELFHDLLDRISRDGSKPSSARP